MGPVVTSIAPTGGPLPPDRLPNSRRPPPHLSKPLPGHKKQKLAHQTAGQVVYALHATDLRHNTSQGSGSDESAFKWFDKANRNVPTQHERSPQTDDDPPFFLSNQQSHIPDNFASSGSDVLFGAEHRGDRENEELRGVIDDLTVENKRLKRLLKSQRSTARPSTDARDRLFELRVHSLSAEKKRELEVLLRNFTTHANTSSLSSSSPSATYGSGNMNNNTRSNPALWNIPPLQTSKLQPTDSGYGSNSHSGALSVAVSSVGKSSIPISKSSRNKNIKNYLHEIPDTFLPRQSPFMSERAKQRMVVSRLEQLFTGKNAAPGEHSQPIQQQEVSQSAAKAEAKPGRQTKLEGSRVAYILPYDTVVNLDAVEREHRSQDKAHNTKSGGSDGSKSNTSASSRCGSPDQRPTRPLDLDIHRAQVASDNIEYIRHLGLSTPHLQPGKDSKTPSWIYLNLLVSMAQLHTLNVTPGFVREAVKKLSTKFELSSDGKQVRWTGGSEGTVFANEVGRSVEAIDYGPSEVTEAKSHGSSKRSKTNSSSNVLISQEPSSEDKISGLQTTDASKQKNSTSASSNLQASSTNAAPKSNSAFEYKPLVYKGKKSFAAASYLESTGSLSPSGESGESGELVRMLSQSSLSHRRQSDEGLITFFSNPYFCCDASADKSPTNWKPQREIMPGLGLDVEQEPCSESPLRHAQHCYFTPQFGPKPYEGDQEGADLYLPVSPIEVAGGTETQPIELEASGIGGVWPEDNFVVDVKVMRRPQDPRNDPKPGVVPLTGSRKRKRYSYRTAKCELIELQPSELPPPSYVFFTSSSSSGDPGMGGSDSETSSSAGEEFSAPAPFLNRWSTGSSDVESEAEEDDFASVDMLELARAADPDRVAAKEREYILNRSGRVEGSVAATVGASPSSSSEGPAEVESEDGPSDMSVDGDDE